MDYEEQMSDLIPEVYEELASLPAHVQGRALESWKEHIQKLRAVDNSYNCPECRYEMYEANDLERPICTCGDVFDCVECLDRAKQAYWGKGV